MKIFAMCPIYDDVRWLKEAVEGAYSVLDRIYLFVADHPWHGASPRDGAIEKTRRAITSLADPDHKIEVVADIWPNEETTRNEAIRIFREAGADYCMMLDSDEIWSSVDLDRMKRVIAASPEVQYWYTHWYIYWKDRLHRIEHGGTPLVFVKLDGQARIAWLRTPLQGGISHTIDAAMHHMAYVRTDEEIQNKVRSITAAHGTANDWFERVWKGWDLNHDLEDLHPVPSAAADFKRAVAITENDLPPALRP